MDLEGLMPEEEIANESINLDTSFGMTIKKNSENGAMRLKINRAEPVVAGYRCRSA